MIMHNLCAFCTFSTFAQKVFKGWDCNFTWSFAKVMRIKSWKMVFVERILRHKLCMIYAFFNFLFKNHFWPKIIFLLLRNIWLPGVHCILVLFEYALRCLIFLECVRAALIRGWVNPLRDKDEQKNHLR